MLQIISTDIYERVNSFNPMVDTYEISNFLQKKWLACCVL